MKGDKDMHKYGMRIRGFSIGCQPMDGFIERQDDPSGRYHDILVYDRKLTEEETRHYSLDHLDGNMEREVFGWEETDNTALCEMARIADEQISVIIRTWKSGRADVSMIITREDETKSSMHASDLYAMNRKLPFFIERM